MKQTFSNINTKYSNINSVSENIIPDSKTLSITQETTTLTNNIHDNNDDKIIDNSQENTFIQYISESNFEETFIGKDSIIPEIVSNSFPEKYPQDTFPDIKSSSIVTSINSEVPNQPKEDFTTYETTQNFLSYKTFTQNISSNPNISYNDGSEQLFTDFTDKKTGEENSSIKTDIIPTNKISKTNNSNELFTEILGSEKKIKEIDTDAISETTFSKNIETSKKTTEGIFSDEGTNSEIPDKENTLTEKTKTNISVTEEIFTNEISQSEINLSQNSSEIVQTSKKSSTIYLVSENLNKKTDTEMMFEEDKSEETSPNTNNSLIISPSLFTHINPNITEEEFPQQEFSTTSNITLTNYSYSNLLNTEEELSYIFTESKYISSVISDIINKTTEENINIDNRSDTIIFEQASEGLLVNETNFNYLIEDDTGIITNTKNTEKLTFISQTESEISTKEKTKETFNMEQYTTTFLEEETNEKKSSIINYDETNKQTIIDNSSQKLISYENEREMSINEKTEEIINTYAIYTDINFEVKPTTQLLENYTIDKSGEKISNQEITKNSFSESNQITTEENIVDDITEKISNKFNTDGELETIYTKFTEKNYEIISDTNTYINDEGNEEEPPKTIITDINTHVEDYSTTNITEKINTTYIITTLPQEVIIESTNLTKEQIFRNLNEILSNHAIGSNYKIFGPNFTLTIKSTKSKEFNEDSTNIDFSKCETLLRKKYNIPDSEILTIAQLEINNTDNTLTLTNQVEYQIFDKNNNPLDISVCKDTDITINYLMNDKSLATINQNLVKEFKDLDINILDINDKFFNDLCQPFSYNNKDIILEDRFNFIYQNYSFCEKNCNNTNIDFEKKFVTCECKTKQEMSTTNVEPNFQFFDKNKLKYSNIDVVKCTNVIFSFKNKSKNSGFILFFILVLTFIFLIGLHFYRGIEPVQEFIYGEMKKYNYLKNDDRKFFEETNWEKDKKFSSLKHKKTDAQPNVFISNNNTSGPNSILNINKIKKTPQTLLDLNPNKSKSLNASSERNLVFNNNLFANKSIINEIKENPPIKRIIANKKKKVIPKTPTKPKSKISEIKQNQAERKESKEKKDVDNFGIIKIDLNESMQNYFPKDSYKTLRNYTYNEAIKYDNRNICQIFYIFLLSKQIIFHTLLENSPLVPFQVKYGILLFLFTFDITINAMFYTNSNISKRYLSEQNLFSFTMSNNTVIIILSTLVSLVLLPLLIRLSKTESGIRTLFRKEEAKIKKNKNYKTDYPTKVRIFTEVEEVLKKYKIRLYIIFAVEFVCILFFWFFVTAFCQVYSNTQGSLVLNCFISILIRFAIEVLLCLLLAKLYTIAAHIEYMTFYKIMLFVYDFSW